MRAGSPLLALAVLWLIAPAAHALPYTGTFLFQLGEASNGPLPALSLSGSGSGDPTLPSISAGSFVGTNSSPVTGNPPISQVFLSIGGNTAGSVGSGPSFVGTAQIRGFGFGIPFINVFLNSRLGFASATVPPLHGGGSTSTSAHFGAWTAGVASVVRTHTIQSAACVASANSPNCPTAMLGGATADAGYFGGAAQIVLVAPVDLYVNTGGIGGIPSFAVMALNFVPEPGSALLLGAGALALARLGRGRRR